MMLAWRRKAGQPAVFRGKAVYAGVALYMIGLWCAGCGGGGAANAPGVAGTAAGTYALTLTGTSPGTTAQVTLMLTVH